MSPWTTAMMAGCVALMIVGVPVTGQAPALYGGAGSVTTTRIDAPLEDPVAVSVAFSQMVAPQGADGVKIASAADFPDALGAAQHQPIWPLLLTGPDGLDDRVRAELVRLDASMAAVIGGEFAVGEQVIDELRQMGLNVTRYAGPTRIETAVALAEAAAHNRFLLVRAFPASTSDATQAFADSLAAGALAAIHGDFGILLTQTEALTSATGEFLRQRQSAAGPITVIVVGGTAAISEHAVAEVATITSDVRRVAGPSRGTTATAVADVAPPPSGALLLNGRHPNAWAAGFAGAAHARLANSPVVLTEPGSLPQETEAWLATNAISTLTCGPGVAEDVCDRARAAASGGSGTPSAATDLWIVETRPDGSDEVVRLAPDGSRRWTSTFGGYLFDPAWNADASRWAASAFASFDHPAGIVLGEGSTGAQNGNLHTTTDSVGEAAFHPADAARVVFTDLGEVRVGSADDPAAAQLIHRSDDAITELGWSSDGAILFHTVEYDYSQEESDGSARLVDGAVWRVEADGTDLTRLPADGLVEGVAISDDGSHVVAIGPDQRSVDVRTATGELVQRYATGGTLWLGDVTNSGAVVFAGYSTSQQEGRPAIMHGSQGHVRVIASLGEQRSAERPVFSPGGEHVAFLEVSDCCRYGLTGDAVHLVRSDGTRLQRLSLGTSTVEEVGWTAAN